MEILITGGNGILGRHLASAMRHRGDAVRVLALPADDTRWLESHGVTIYRGDVRQFGTLGPAMRGARAVVHLACLRDGWRPFSEHLAINVTGTENVCRAALREKVQRLVHVSSWMVYGIGLGEAAREDFLLHPFKDPYAISKALADKAVQRMIAEDSLPATIIRPAEYFGPGDLRHFARIACRMQAGRAVIIGTGDNALPFVYVTDVVLGTLLCLDHESAVGQAFNITTNQPMTQARLFDAIAREIGASPPRIHLPYALACAVGSTHDRITAVTGVRRHMAITRQEVNLYGTDNRQRIDKAARQLGYRPQVDLRTGTRYTAAWYLDTFHGPSYSQTPHDRSAFTLPQA